MKTFLATAFALVLPVSAFAIPLTSDFGSGLFELTPGQTESFDFEVSDATDLDILFSGIGFNSGSDLELVTFGIDSADMSFDPSDVMVFAPTTLASVAKLISSSVLGDFTVYYTLDASAENSVFVGFAGQASTVPVPLPASGMILVSALGAVALVRRRRS
ncbi:VPLPA-CTERM sorting domain-containing protein [Tropicimonas sp. IMCC34043]|uniref:VPLPA-CTERM sorting domain-containing protein n=1 Tax=Tropicimonas sp. IMCC34043 TaxID=2248760 RepID=UPI000E284597|nr:VPLPA-CTERM sorting domain-containing protein [Tropicimonas sp. IMCC34043]